MGTLIAGETAAAHRRYPVAADEDVGVLRRAVRALAAKVPGLPDGEAELAATELATNLLRHAAPGGHVLARLLGGSSGRGVELIAVDHGPGLPAAVLESLAAGIDPALPSLRRGSLGVGLAAVRRRATVFDYYSAPDGTVILARLCADPTPATEPWQWAGINVPLGGDGPSGDGWAVATATHLAALVVDGLGHGPEAAAAAQAAFSVFERRNPAAIDGSRPHEPWLTEFARDAHEAMRATRGGVLGACLIERNAGRLLFAGIGNIHGRIVAGSAREHLASRPGTLGTQLSAPQIHTSTHPWTPGSVLVLASDGIDTRWDPATHPGLLRRHPALIAALIHRDHTRGRDDATVLVVQENRAETRTEADR